MSRQRSTTITKGFSKFLSSHGIDSDEPGVQILLSHMQQWIKEKQVDDEQYEKDMRLLQWSDTLQLDFDVLLYEMIPVENDPHVEELPPPEEYPPGSPLAGQKPPKQNNLQGDLDSYKLYCAEVRNYPPLDAEGSKQLSEVYILGQEAQKALENNGSDLSPSQIEALKETKRAGDAALKKLESGNLWLSIVLAKQYYARATGINILDLIQEGNLGLMTAAERFDPKKNVAFACYATHWVKKNIRTFLIKNQVIRIPQGIYEDNEKLLRAQASIKAELGRDPTVELLAERTKLSVKRVNEVIRVCNLSDVISSQTPIAEDDKDATTLESTFSDESANKVFMRIEDGEMSQVLQKAIQSVLTPLEAKIILLRCGYEDKKEYSLEAIGLELGYEKERIRQIIVRAQEKLQNMPISVLYGHPYAGSEKIGRMKLSDFLKMGGK